LTPKTEDEELNRVFRAINEIAPETPLILQPVTPMGGVKKPVPPRRLMDILRRSETQIKNVRLIPQTHKMYGAL
jgi:organic radical activating enzyme